MARLSFVHDSLHGRFGLLRLAPIWLLAGACHLVVTPGGDSDDTESDEAGAQARACGDRTCGDDTVCCNASCGICTAPDNACIQIACEPSDRKASCKTVLCGPSDTCMETPAGAVCVPPAENPCNLVDCQPNSACQVEQGAAICTPVNGGSGDAGMPVKKDAGTGGASDAGAPPALDAGAAHDAGGPPPSDAGAPALDASTAHDASAPAKDASEPKDTGIIVVPITCATVLCPTGTYCDDISGVAECIPLPSCATVKCSAGHHCELHQVQCIRAPCPPQPACVPDEQPGNTCDTLKCKAGTHCELTEVQCITAPCDPIAQCVADKGGCGCSGKGACLDIVCPVVGPTD